MTFYPKTLTFGSVMSYSTTLESFAFAFCTIATKGFLEKNFFSTAAMQPSFRMLKRLCVYQESSINGGLSGSEGAGMAERKGKVGWVQAAS